MLLNQNGLNEIDSLTKNVKFLQSSIKTRSLSDQIIIRSA